ncbi:MAG: hypothetical protein ACLTSZ_04410 [Lachnospiraceae bacterium]
MAGHAAEDDTTMTAVRAKKTGWVKEGKWYFYYGKNGKKVTGWQKGERKAVLFPKAGGWRCSGGQPGDWF